MSVLGAGTAILVQRRINCSGFEYSILKRREQMPSLMLGVPKR